MRNTILSEFHQAKRFMPAAIASAMTMPPVPPSSQPQPMNSAVMAASKIPVLKKFTGVVSPFTKATGDK
jgi:hypothetical protein